MKFIRQMARGLLRILGRSAKKKQFSERDYFLQQFQNLQAGEVDHFLKVINEEAEKSAGYGLVIEKEDIYLEKATILSLVSYFGGSVWVRDLRSQDQKGIDVNFQYCISRALELPLKYYFEQTPEGEVKNRYNRHLDSLMSRILKDISDNKIPIYI